MYQASISNLREKESASDPNSRVHVAVPIPSVVVWAPTHGDTDSDETTIIAESTRRAVHDIQSLDALARAAGRVSPWPGTRGAAGETPTAIWYVSDRGPAWQTRTARCISCL